MKNVFNFFSLALIFLLFNGTVAHAQTRTCAKVLMHQYKADVGLFVALPVFGWALGLMLLGETPKLRRDAKRLEAATTITKELDSERDIADALLVIDRFYEKLIRMYPTMKLSKLAVINVLHRFNSNSVKNGRCRRPIYELFPDNNAKKYLAYEKKWKQENKEKIQARRDAEKKYQDEVAQAVHVRNEKNSQPNKRYFEDDI